MTRTLRQYLQDIQSAVNTLERLVSGMSFEQLRGDERTILAVMMSFAIIGEAAKGVPQSVREQYPQLPWRDMAGMRDNVVHEYFKIKVEILWRTVQEDIPQLKALI